jgi:hypothetical protein
MLEITPDVIRIAETLDHIMTIDVVSRGSIPLLYRAARGKLRKPLALTAAEELAMTVKRGDLVFFLTGFLVRTQFSPEIAESDGPPGVALLARTIYKVLGGIPVVLIEDSIAKRMSAVMEAAGFFMVPIEKANEVAKPSPRVSQGAIVQSFPLDVADPLSVAKTWIEKCSPAAVISVERGGPNALGKTHNAQGMDLSHYHARTDLLLKYAYEKDGGPLTISVGDGGNEVGMGNIAEDLRKWLPYGTECQCPCKRGIIPETRTDILVASSVSNWGAYAIAAALALLGQDSEAAPNAELEEKTVRRGAEVGFIDSPTGKTDAWVDGMPGAINSSIARLLEQTVIHGLKALSGTRLWKVQEYRDQDQERK